MLDFRILGRLEVERDGSTVELTGRRPISALVLLLLEANHVVPAERVIDALWGEDPPPTAQTALRNVVSELRKLLGNETIETRPPGYALRVDPDAVDLTRVERRIAAAGEAHGPERARLLREALAEWRGPPFQDIPYATFLQGEARRIDELELFVREELFEAELEAGADAELVPRIESLVATNPHRERLRGQLMLALYRSGRQAEALQAYHGARRMLADELGLEPSPALRRLHGSILRQEAELESAAPRVHGNADRAELPDVAAALLAGRLVPVLAAATDVAADLAGRFAYPPGEVMEISRVSQYAASVRGHGPLHDELRAHAAANGEPTSVHRFFATLPPLLRERGLPHQLLVTTDYDGALERAFADAGEEVDVVAYLASGPHRGRFCHISPDGTVRVIEVPSEYATELSLERRTVILRVRGRADTSSGEWESFVVTEDDHLEYLRRADVAAALPVGLAATLRRSHFLFLGYAVRDWCLRLVLGRVCPDTPLAYRSWAITPAPGPAERELWAAAGVDLLRAPLDDYVDALARAVGAEREVEA
jgi:DNA-binding SARP family transcriptional activator